MKVQRQGERGIIKQDYCVFLVYDETQSFDEEANYRTNYYKANHFLLKNEIKNEVIQTALDLYKTICRKAYGHPHLCYFTIYKDAPTKFEFDADYQYTPNELKKIMQLANKAKQRCKFLTVPI